MRFYDICVATPVQMHTSLHAPRRGSIQQVTQEGERTSTNTSAPPLKAQKGHLESTRWLCTCTSKDNACYVLHRVRARVYMAIQTTTPHNKICCRGKLQSNLERLLWEAGKQA